MSAKDKDGIFERFPEKEAELRHERRRESGRERLKTNNPRCIFCDESDPSVLECHHMAGRAYGNDTVIVCRNHHRKLSDLQKDHPARITEIPDALEVIAHFLLGLADFLEFLIAKLREFAAQLVERADVNALNVEEPQS